MASTCGSIQPGRTEGGPCAFPFQGGHCVYRRNGRFCSYIVRLHGCEYGGLVHVTKVWSRPRSMGSARSPVNHPPPSNSKKLSSSHQKALITPNRASLFCPGALAQRFISLKDICPAYKTSRGSGPHKSREAPALIKSRGSGPHKTGAAGFESQRGQLNLLTFFSFYSFFCTATPNFKAFDPLPKGWQTRRRPI